MCEKKKQFLKDKELCEYCAFFPFFIQKQKLFLQRGKVIRKFLLLCFQKGFLRRVFVCVKRGYVKREKRKKGYNGLAVGERGGAGHASDVR